MDQNIVITSYTSDDCNATLQLWQSAAEEIRCVDERLEYFITDPRKWNRFLRANKTYVARCGEKIVGMGVLDIDISCSMCATAKICFLCVHRSSRRQGYGTALISTLEKTAESNMVSLICSDVSPSAIPFFESVGYSVYHIDLRQPSDLSRMIKEL